MTTPTCPSHPPLVFEDIQNPKSHNVSIQTLYEANIKPYLCFSPSSLAYLDDQNLICIGGYDGTLSLWDSNTLERLALYNKFSQDSILHIKYYKERRLLILFSSTIKIAKVISNKQIQVIKTLDSHYFHNEFLGILADQDLLVTKTLDYNFNIFSLSTLTTKRRVSPYKITHSYPLKYLCIPTKHLILTLSHKRLEGYNILTGQRLWTHILPKDAEISTLSYCRKNNNIVGISTNGEVNLWKLVDGKEGVQYWSSFKLEELESAGQIICVSSEGNILIRDMNKVLCLNIQERNLSVCAYESLWSEPVIMTSLEEEKVYVLSWTTKVIKAISIIEKERRDSSPMRAVRKLDTWIKSVWSALVPFVPFQ